MTNFDSLCYQCKRVLSNIQKTLQSFIIVNEITKTIISLKN